MRVLGLGTGGDSGAAVVDDGRILAAINEERLARLKLVTGFPRASIREVLRLSGCSMDEFAAVLVGSRCEFFVDPLQPFDGWFEKHGRGGVGERIKAAAGRFSRHRDRLPILEPLYYAALSPSYRWSRLRTRRVLRREFGVRCPIVFVDHHLAHLASAYVSSGFRNALVLSMDGGGDGRSSLVYAVRDGRWEYVHETSAFHSLGNYYAYITHICGFKAQKHEGKVTGLAAHGEPRYVDLLRSFVDEEGGRLFNRAGVVFTGAIRELRRRLPAGWAREDLAASMQVHCEELVRRYVGHWARHTGMRQVALAGGVFANVRVNQEVHRLPGVDRIHVHPHMGDGGLAVGAAMAATIPAILPTTMPHEPAPLNTVYLGTPITDDAAERAIRGARLHPVALDGPLEEKIAELLAEGYVVARAAGAMEYGPRALGHRSILYQPTDPSVNDWLNHNLRRTEFMPFAPSVLYEWRDVCFDGIAGAEHAAEFMTVTFDCSPWMRDAMPGVVHVDGTARPHLVRFDREPKFYRIIEAFRRRTGLPAIINTSFNMHEAPIVRTADDAVAAFLDGNLDFLALGNLLVEHPRGPSHPMHPVAHAHATIA